MNRKQRRATAKVGQTSSYPGATAATAATLGAAELLRAGLEHHQAGGLAEAETYYRRVLAADPRHADALYLLGVVAQQVGRADLAVDLIGQAIKRNKQNPLYHLTRATALEDLQQLDQALACYDKALALKPDYAEAFYSRGIALKKLGRLEEALASFDQALALKPDFAEAFNTRAVALLELQHFDEAVMSFDKALVLKPDYVEAFHNRGVALQRLKRLEEALASYDNALALNPDFAEALTYRGSALQELRRLDDALACYDKALTLKPDDVDALDQCGGALQEARRFDDALACYDRALALKPDYVEAWNNRGCALQAMKRLDQALASFDQALALKPDYAEAFFNRGVTLRQLKRSEAALASFENALALQPDHAQAFSEILGCVNDLCDWDRSALLAGDVIAQVTERKSILFPFTLIGSFGDPSVHLQCASNYVAHIFPTLPRPLWTGSTWRHDKVRIAYLSADLHLHATAHLMAELFERHDRSRFEVTAISFGVDDGSAMRKRLVAAFDRFVDVRHISDGAVARLLHDLRVDIAIDLKGHLEDSRPGILAYRPAPIQASYLGYPGTTGAAFIDYVIADKIVAPLEHQAFFTEKIVHLPDTYQVNDTKRITSARIPTRQEVGLPEQGFVFCCFNQGYKIKPDVFDVWMRLLHAVDGSVLWLFHNHESTAQNLRNEARKRGIDPVRLVFAGPLSIEDHLARHRLADLFLDTLPYNAHTTASDALWAGVPLVTQLGDAFAGRVAASLLNAIGLPELVTHSPEDYQTLALRLATNPSLLEGYRRRLAENRLTHPLFDTDRFRLHIEQAYLQMWEIWQRGEQPKSFVVQAEPAVPANVCNQAREPRA
jgi:protein O-GlcNAc transferase